MQAVCASIRRKANGIWNFATGQIYPILSVCLRGVIMHVDILVLLLNSLFFFNDEFVCRAKPAYILRKVIYKITNLRGALSQRNAQIPNRSFTLITS